MPIAEPVAAGAKPGRRGDPTTDSDPSVDRPLVCAACPASDHCLRAHQGDTRPSRARSRILRRDEVLYRPGDPYVSLFVVRRGSLKTSVPVRAGCSQVVGFFSEGSMLGLDGLPGQRYACEAIALEPSEVCAVPQQRLPARWTEVFARERTWFGQEIARERDMMLRLGSLRAEERVAAFLLDWEAAQHHACGPGAQLVLSMTREDIGSYLGLTLETVSRTLSRMAARGWIRVCGRQVVLVDLGALQSLLSPGARIPCVRVNPAEGAGRSRPPGR